MMRPYMEYQPTDISWLGQVPAHWVKNKFKFLLNEKTKVQNLALPCGSISFGRVVFKDSERLSEETKAAYQEVLSGEFLINPLNLNYDLKSLRTALAGIDVIVSSGYIVLKSLDVVDKAYLRWLLYLFDVRHMKTLGAGIRQTISFKDIADCAVYIPSDTEQQAIAIFLDRETQRIDSLIEEKQTFIQLLKEKRQTLINHVVTKGLNPNVEMHNSGIEWIGQVPKHWKLITHSYVINKIEQGWSPQADSRPPSGTQWGVTKLSSVKSGTFYPDECKALLDGDDPSKGLKVQADDFLISRANTPELVGDVCVVGDIGTKNIILCDLIYKISYSDEVFNRYMMYWFLSSSARSQVKLDARGSSMTMAKISQSHIKAWKVPLPTLAEQKSSVTYLDKSLSKIDEISAEVEYSISLLKERRTSLISAAVTGKIDVRETI
ncbi:restriction endonuclease subunit S [Aeromonas sp.]|uniref:restriction endonuclease subunit S n=1 Tax=Aeromonas sp. TaxID=647 RepID=UPI00258DFF6A|nr:restriction endonuclease subunit S [Aeromonas sp.]